ncbi:MAG TPA: BamA/TamA family outer membrane protein [Planctomycetota bacterium]|nr:BamA/TamA family outer membrane protein [Planctomycetota bacterium]
MRLTLPLAALLVFAIVTASRLPAQDPQGAYDPLAGVDPDGRIPKPQLPGDLPNPERWRYTPPGRIKPGGVFDRFLVSSFLSPIVFSEADIGFGGGFALTDVDFRDQRYREFANIVMTYSAEGQQAYRINWSRWLNVRDLDNGGVLREERGRLYGRAGYEKTLTRRFFGFGSRTPESNETSYTEELTFGGFGVRVPLPDPGGDWLVRADLQAERHGLSKGRVTGVPSTDDVVGGFPVEFASGDGVDQLWLLTSFGWDTRDSLHQPYEGKRLGISANGVYGSGGEFGAILGIDAQHVFALPPLLHRGAFGREENPPTDVLAFGAFVQDTVGDMPFYSLPTLGGTQTLRGYIQNRFTDRAAAHFSAEYRLSLIPRGITFTDTIRIERIGFAVFYDCGTVADGIEKLADGRYLDSYGFGLRIAFSRDATFRVDWGYSDEGVNFTLAFGNSF